MNLNLLLLLGYVWVLIGKNSDHEEYCIDSVKCKIITDHYKVIYGLKNDTLNGPYVLYFNDTLIAESGYFDMGYRNGLMTRKTNDNERVDAIYYSGQKIKDLFYGVDNVLDYEIIYIDSIQSYSIIYTDGDTIQGGIIQSLKSSKEFIDKEDIPRYLLGIQK